MDNKDRNTGRLLLLITALGWGLAGVCVKSITWRSMSIVFVRSLVSFIALAIIKKSVKIKFTKKNVLAGIGMISTGILYMIALKMTNAGTAIVLQYVAPVLIFLYSVIFKNRKTTKTELFLVFAVFVGIIISFGDTLDPTYVLGNIIALASGFTFAVQIFITNEDDCDTQDSIMIASLIGVIVSLPFFIFDGTVIFTKENIMWVMILAIFQYAIPNICYSIGIQKVDVVEASIILTIEPIFNPIPVAIFCGEHMGTLSIIGAVIVIASVTAFAIYQSRKTQKYNSEL